MFIFFPLPVYLTFGEWLQAHHALLHFQKEGVSEGNGLFHLKLINVLPVENEIIRSNAQNPVFIF